VGMAPVGVGLVGLSAIVAVVGVLLALRQLRDVAKRPSPACRDLPAKLRRLSVEERLAKGEALTEPGTWEANLMNELATARSDVERADSASEAVGDLASLYASRSRWAPAALRIQLAVGLLSAALLLAWGHRLEALAALVVAVIGGVVSHMVGDRAAERERAQRSLADEIVLLLVPDLSGGRRRTRSRAW
jgi:hypothetical protein